MERQDRFRMELQPGLQRLGIADRHRHAVDLGMDPEPRRQPARAQRMVAADAAAGLRARASALRRHGPGARPCRAPARARGRPRRPLPRRSPGGRGRCRATALRPWRGRSARGSSRRRAACPARATARSGRLRSRASSKAARAATRLRSTLMSQPSRSNASTRLKVKESKLSMNRTVDVMPPLPPPPAPRAKPRPCAGSRRPPSPDRCHGRCRRRRGRRRCRPCTTADRMTTRGVHHPVAVEPADRAAIGAALGRLGLAQQLGRADLGRAGQGADIEAGLERIDRVHAGPQACR